MVVLQVGRATGAVASDLCNLERAPLSPEFAHDERPQRRRAARRALRAAAARSSAASSRSSSASS
ncbi:hypothetical protein QVL82_13695, partial [Cellulosimicrobium funkei]|uniref:hypothetical protein n=1 Tax=Cellulosimicrobium funkei TaxID=264251 RepID=UPI003758308E